MAILKVARLGHPVLRTKAEPVPVPEIGSARIQQLIDDLFETMREYQGIGLAAPQVHVSSRIFVAGLRPPPLPSEGQGGSSAGVMRGGSSAGVMRGASSAGVMDDEHDMPLIVLVNPELSLLPGGADEAWE
ncbi:MAG TPA: peptide deformylase, partial [Vicinamibacterales bacterium]